MSGVSVPASARVPFSENGGDWSIYKVVSESEFSQTWGFVKAKNAEGRNWIVATYVLDEDVAKVNYAVGTSAAEKLQANKIILKNNRVTRVERQTKFDFSKPKMWGDQAVLHVSTESRTESFYMLEAADQNEKEHGSAAYYLHENAPTEVKYYFGTSIEAKQKMDAWMLKKYPDNSIVDITDYTLWGGRKMESEASKQVR